MATAYSPEQSPSVDQLNQKPQQKNPDITQEAWYQGLPENQRADVLKIREQVEELEKRLNVLDASKKYNGTGVKSLEVGLANLQKRANADITGKKPNPEKEKDSDAKRTISELKGFESRFKAASEEADGVSQLITKLNTEIEKVKGGIASMEQEIKTNETKEKDISKMSNAELLTKKPEERLPYITKGNKEAKSIVTGVSVEFTFTTDGKLNRELYLYTTAGQVLPKEVRSVSTGGVVYERLGVSGEFYDPETHKRLVIKEGTQVDITKTEDVSKLSGENIKKYQEFIKSNPEYNTEVYKNIIETAVEKGIEPKMFAIVTERRIEEFETQKSIEQSQLDTIAADVARGLSGIAHGEGKYSIEAAAKIAKKTTPTAWQETLEKYGYKKEELTQYATRNPEKAELYNLTGLESFIPAEYSVAASRSASGTTECSKTARLNLTKMGIIKPYQGLSAKNSFEMYGTSPSQFPPNGQSEAKAADFYLDASKENAEHGHRVAAFQKNGAWYVLDPYYAMPGMGKTQQPIPAELYTKTMEAKGRRLWGAHYFS